MIQSQQNKYLETTVQTASPAKLMIMLYDGAIRFCKQGAEAIQQKNYQDAHTNLMKAQDIILEFIITLDKSSEVGEPLARLYEYFVHLLMEANTKKKVEPIQEVVGYLVDLKGTWLQAAKTATSANAGVKHG